PGLENRHRGAIESGAHTHRIARPLQNAVSRSENVVFRDPEQTPRRLVVARHLALPIRQPGPGTSIPNTVWRGHGSTTVRNGPARHRAAVQDHHVPERANIEKPAEP